VALSDLNFRDLGGLPTASGESLAHGILLRGEGPKNLDEAHRDELRALGIAQPVVHVENSAGLIGFPAQAGDMVRAGLMLYGSAPRPEFQPRLRAVMTWKTGRPSGIGYATRGIPRRGSS